MIRWSAITLRAGVMLHGETKEKETGTDRDNERTRGGMKRGCYTCVLCAMSHTCAYTEKHLQCAHRVHTSALRKRGKGQRRDRRWREREEAVIEGWGDRGPGIREREEDSSEKEFMEGRGSRAGPTGTTTWREQKNKEEGRRGGGRSRILTERWGMSRRVVCSHGSSLSTAVQYAGQGKVTLLCVRECARARLLAVPHTLSHVSACICIRHHTVALSRCDSIVVRKRR